MAINVTPVTAQLSKILYKISITTETKDMQGTKGKAVLVVFMLLGIVAVASVMTGPAAGPTAGETQTSQRPAP